jgi:hypothetical protein
LNCVFLCVLLLYFFLILGLLFLPLLLLLVLFLSDTQHIAVTTCFHLFMLYAVLCFLLLKSGSLFSYGNEAEQRRMPKKEQKQQNDVKASSGHGKVKLISYHTLGAFVSRGSGHLFEEG